MQQLCGFVDSYHIQIICTQLYGLKYFYLIQIICTLLYVLKYLSNTNNYAVSSNNFYSIIITCLDTVIWFKAKNNVRDSLTSPHRIISDELT